mgnify:CR=1 FL=1
MNNQEITIIKRELVWFLIPTFVITYGLAAFAYSKGGLEHFPVMVVSMYVPALVVILNYVLNFKRNVFKNNNLGLRFVGMKYWLLAPLILLAIVASTYTIPFLFNTDFFKNTTEILTSTEKTGLGVGNWLLNLAIIFGINTLVAPLLNILMFLGEELAWRGFLFPRLLCLFGTKRSFIMGGTIWALWHAGGIMLGWNYPDHPLIGNILMILLCIPMGLIFQYLYFKSKSIFVPALAHGAMNWTAGNFIMFVLADPDYNKLIYGPTGIIGIIIFWIIAITLFRKMDWEKENTFSPNVSTAQNMPVNTLDKVVHNEKSKALFSQ